jgi:hypothetical protein
MRGLAKVKEFHDNNTGLGYFPFKIAEDAKDKTAIVRVLAAADYSGYNEDGTPVDDTETVIQSLFIHNQFKVINSTRCTSNDVEPDKEKCPLCRVGVPRSLKTYIPVRVRGDEKVDRVQIIEYGRNHLSEVQSFIEELPNADITATDIKIKRSGKKTNTEYKWYVVPKSDRPLDEDELALEIPDMEAIIPIREVLDLEKRAAEWEKWKKAKDSKTKDGETEDEEDDEDADKLPF